MLTIYSFHNNYDYQTHIPNIKTHTIKVIISMKYYKIKT
jgi:hypothetical protein